MTLVGDRERERAAAELQRHYLHGRLSVDELSERAALVLRARSRMELGEALRDLPYSWDGIRAAGRTAVRGAMLLALTGVWLVFSFVLLVAFVLALIVHGPSLGEAIGFPAVWIAASYLLWRLWRTGAARRG